MTRTVTGSLAALAVMAAACGGKSTDPGTTPVTGAPVTGFRLNTYFQDDGTTLVRVSPDLAQTSVAAFMLEGGTYRESPGAFDPGGSYSIPDVGSGSYLLQVTPPNLTPRFYEQSAHPVDLGAELVGRPSRLYALLSSPLTFSLTNLEPWATGNAVTLLSTGARFNTVAAAPVAFVAGSTSGDFTIDFSFKPLPAAGDLGWILQSAQRTAGTPAVTYTVVARAAMLATTVTMADGDAATLAVPMSVPATGTVGMDLHRSEFLALLPTMAPSATVTSGTFTVAVRAYPRTLSSTVTGALLNLVAPAGTGDLNLGPLSYPRPFPAWFTECRALDYVVWAKVPGALGVSGTTIMLNASRLDPLPSAPAVIAPLLGPVSLPKIAGRDALLPQGGVGLTPTLSWSAPSLGAPTRYAVTITELTGGGYVARASITVTGTSVTIPPLVMVPGSVYVAVIAAISEPNFDFAAPNRLTAPRDLVPFVTAPFAP